MGTTEAGRRSCFLFALLFVPLLAGCGEPSFPPPSAEEPGLEQIRQEVVLHARRSAAAASLEEVRAELDRYELAVGEGLEVLRAEVAAAACQHETPALLAMMDGLGEVVAAHREAIEGAAVLADAKADCRLHCAAMEARIEQLDSQTAACGDELEARARD